MEVIHFWLSLEAKESSHLQPVNFSTLRSRTMKKLIFAGGMLVFLGTVAVVIMHRHLRDVSEALDVSDE